MNLRWFEFKVKVMFWRMGVMDKFHRFIYCRRHLHRLIAGSSEVTNSKGLHLKTQYLRCIYCDCHFFVNKKNKEHYRRIRQRERGDFSKAINSLNLKENVNMKKMERRKLTGGKMRVTEFKVR
jgi:hypothetical protein